MCGFLAEFSFDGKPLTSSETFDKLLALSKHRGPDHTLTHAGIYYQLGFNRLAIIDTSNKGNQPKLSPSGRYHVVFNGEIYNFKQLAETYDLQNLRSTSDTEVILHLLDELGVEQTIELLNGMFAITIIDSKTENCFLARDFAGIKPLFFGVSSNGVVAASQFDQIYKHPWHKEELKLRSDMVKEYFGFGYMQAPNTIYETIFQVNPGEIIQVDLKGDITKIQLVSFFKNQNNTSKRSLKEVLINTVERQLISDVPVATFLSGGIDSPLISAYAKKAKPDIEAFTIKVNDPDLNESDIAKAYADALGLKQKIFTVEASDLVNCVDRHFEAFPEPFGDYSSIPTYEITKHARKGHTVMLSGDGGDELFFGYPRMRDILRKRLWFKFPLFLRKFMVRITNTLGVTKTWAPYFRSLDEFIINKHLHIPKSILDKAFYKTDFSAETRHLYRFKNTNRSQLLEQLRWNEFYAHMQRILVKVDRASMKHSLEVRVPFLDKESILKATEYSSTLKDKQDLKAPLKKLLYQEVSESIVNTKKMGFTVPLFDWLHNELKQDVQKQIFDIPFYGQEVMNVSILQKYVRDFYEGKHSDSWGIWHIYSWQKWSVEHVI